MFKILCHLLNLPVKRVMYDQHGHPGFNMEAAIQTLREGQDLTGKNGVLIITHSCFKARDAIPIEELVL